MDARPFGQLSSRRATLNFRPRLAERADVPAAVNSVQSFIRLLVNLSSVLIESVRFSIAAWRAAAAAGRYGRRVEVDGPALRRQLFFRPRRSPDTATVVESGPTWQWQGGVRTERRGGGDRRQLASVKLNREAWIDQFLAVIVVDATSSSGMHLQARHLADTDED